MSKRLPGLGLPYESEDIVLRRYRAGEAKLQQVADHIEGELPEGVNFALTIFTVGKGGYAGYVSNAQRPDMIAALRECVDTLEARMDVGPGAPISTDRPRGSS